MKTICDYQYEYSFFYEKSSDNNHFNADEIDKFVS